MITRRERGQGLVEMAIAAPILIFILLGLFEVGYALRSYYVLANANRETARYAVRTEGPGGYLNFRADSREEVGYERLVEHAHAALGDLGDDFIKEGHGTIIVSYISINPGFPCDPAKRAKPTAGDDWPNCDCETAVTHPFSPTVVITPKDGPQYFYRYPVSSTLTSKLDIEAQVELMRQSSLKINCARVKHGAIGFSEQAVAVEFFYSHYQLFGFPLISNPLTDPIPFYAHTVMRKPSQREDK